MITLPFPPRKSHIRMLCGAVGFAFGLVAWLFVWAVSGNGLSLLAAPTGIALGLGISYWDDAALFAYRAVNKLARDFSVLASLWISSLIFLVVVAAGLVGSKLATKRQIGADSHWRSIHGRHELRRAVWAKKGGFRSFVHWVSESGSWWAILLLPHFLLLRTFAGERNKYVAPQNIYTLY